MINAGGGEFTFPHLLIFLLCFHVCFSDHKSHVLSVRQEVDPQTGDPSVKHYRIKQLDNGMGYYIAPKKTFADLFELIDYYKSESE
jgi:hypothetical protein